MGFVSPSFWTWQNISNILVTETGKGILALGAALVMIAGGIDLSVGATLAMASVFACSLQQEGSYAQRILPETFAQAPVIVSIFVGVLAGGLIGAINGFCVAKLKVPAFITTLGTTTIAKGIALLYTDSFPVSSLVTPYKQIAQGSLFNFFPIIILYLIFFFILTWVILSKTTFGKKIYAVGGNMAAARVAGINIKRVHFTVFLLNGMFAGFVGVILSARSGAGAVTLGVGYELDAIAAAVIGGTASTGGIGTALGVIIGILVLGILNNGMLLLGLSPYVQQIIKGIIIIGAVAFDMKKNAIKK